MNKTIYRTVLAASLLVNLSAVAQEQPVEDLEALSLEELMNVPIRSASKKDETLFDAPLSSYTITRADIDRAGSTSIMEALRLAPGVIVREQANGVYDIHIRGLDNILRTSETNTKTNTGTLVMIDNRPVFNHNLGGTFWETLPIDLNDVDRIEIVRGPSAPLFGPNAVTGVINIITRRVAQGETFVNASVQGGTSATKIANFIAGKSFGKFSAGLSGNFQSRDRFQDTYYLPGADQYFTLDQLAGVAGDGIYSQYPDANQAWKKFGANGFLNYRVTEDIYFDVTGGTQQSEVQKIFLSNVFNGSIPFTQNETNTSYVNVAGKVKGFSFRSSYLNGYDNLALNAAPNQYDYNVFDASAEYTFTLGKLGTVVPGVSLQHATLSDENYVEEGLTFLGGVSQDIKTSSAYVRADIKPLEALRVIGALRMDKFSTPDDVYLAYELAATYKINEQNIVRGAVTRSNSGSFVGNNYLNLQVPLTQDLNFVRSGSDNLKLYTVNMIELGYRAQISKAFQVDIDVFRQEAKNFTALVTTNGLDFGNGVFQPTEQKFLNVPTTATQTGVTLGVTYAASDKLHVKPFITVQKTETEALPSSFVDPDLAQALGAPVSYSSSKHENTPGIYGGYYINYSATKSLNVNLNGYFFNAHRQYDQYDAAASSATGDISGKFLLNAKVAYNFGKVTVFVNGRNIVNSESTEFFGADKTSYSLLGGLNLSL
jgi:iron complex outermembrane recepter protein